MVKTETPFVPNPLYKRGQGEFIPNPFFNGEYLRGAFVPPKQEVKQDEGE